MADTQEYKYYDITDTSDNTERHLGVASVNKNGEFGFANDTDEKPYLPAGGEKTLRGEGVSESLTYEQYHWGENTKVKETTASKTNYYSDEVKEERDTDAKNRMEKTSERTGETLKNKDGTKEELETIKVENSISVSAIKETAKPKQVEVKSPSVDSTPKLEGIEKDQLFEPAAGDIKLLVPESVTKNFVQDGKKFYFKGTEDKLAFQDNGTKLKTKVDGDLVADSMIAIAKNRGWSEIKVTGTESFKKDIWAKATEQGIAVKGYTPTKVEQAEMKDKGINIPKQGQSVSPEKSALTPEQEKSKAFKELSATEAVKKYPELAPYIAAVAAIEKKVQADNLSQENQQAIMDRVKQNTANSIDKGIIPNVSLKEVKQVTAQAQLSR